MDKKIGIIYKITNNINGMQYVGKTRDTSPDRRFLDHKCSNYYMLIDIDKYGEDCLSISVIDSAYTEEELTEKETHHILKEDTLYPNGYNITPASSGPRGVSITNLDTGKVYNSSGEAERDLGVFGTTITQACKGTRKTAGGYRWAYTDKNYSGKTYRKTRPVINLDTKKVYPSIKDASEELGLQKSKITLVCRGQRKTTGGYRWAYYEGPLFDSVDTVTIRVQNMDTGEVFDSVNDAARYVKCDSSTISKVCKGKNKTAGGYRWRYYEGDSD